MGAVLYCLHGILIDDFWAFELMALDGIPQVLTDIRGVRGAAKINRNLRTWIFNQNLSTSKIYFTGESSEYLNTSEPIAGNKNK